MPHSTDAVVHREIYQQPATWLTTLDRVSIARDQVQELLTIPAVISGAGTSAYAASAIASAWPGAQPIPSTHLLTAGHSPFPGRLLVSVARSGNSPESLALVESVQKRQPAVRHLAITCNAAGKLAQAPGVNAIVLDERTNDKSLAMTSSFSNLVLAGLCLHHLDKITPVLASICQSVEAALPNLDQQAEQIAEFMPARVCVLASADLYAAACEASLKILEMTAGNTVPIAETYLGLRHGPLAFLRPDTLIFCFLSSDPQRLRYEVDLINELRQKGLGRIAVIGPPSTPVHLFDHLIPANAPNLPDYLRTPFEIVFPQLLAYHLSAKAGFHPDNPSPDGVINRVVQGVSIYEG